MFCKFVVILFKVVYTSVVRCQNLKFIIQQSAYRCIGPQNRASDACVCRVAIGK